MLYNIATLPSMSDELAEEQASTLRSNLSRVLRRAERGVPTIVRRYKDDVAVVISPQDYEDLVRLRTAEELANSTPEENQ